MLKGDLIGQGNTAEIFEWGENYVLKLYRCRLPNELCIKEFEMTEYVYENLKITPRPIDLLRVEGRSGAVYERLAGKTMLKWMLLNPWNFKKYAKLLAKVHLDLHKKADL